MKTSANIEAVRKLCERWAWLSEKEFRELLSENCIYYDMPFPRAKAVAPEAAHAKLSPMQKDWDIGLDVVSIVGDANTVLVLALSSSILVQILVRDRIFSRDNVQPLESIPSCVQ